MDLWVSLFNIFGVGSGSLKYMCGVLTDTLGSGTSSWDMFFDGALDLPRSRAASKACLWVLGPTVVTREVAGLQSG